MADPKSRSNPPKARSIPPSRPSVPPKSRRSIPPKARSVPPKPHAEEPAAKHDGPRMPRPLPSIVGAPKGRLRKIEPAAPRQGEPPSAARNASPQTIRAPASPLQKPPPPLPVKKRSIAPKSGSIPPGGLYLPKNSAAFMSDLSPPPSTAVLPTSNHDEGGHESAAILVVDDDDAARRLIVRALRTLFTVYEAHDGEEAVRILERVSPISCVVTDIMMPRVDGVMLAKKMRADSRLKGVPIVFVTGRGGATGVLDTINVGARFYIQKPFKVKDLVDKVRTVVLTTAGGSIAPR